MDNRLCIKESTKRTFVIEGKELLPIVPEPMVLPFRSPLKPTQPAALSSKLWNICFLPVMCREHPESRYQDWCFNFAVKDICNIYYFVLRYPYRFGLA